ncbi:MAG: SLC13 family permease [Salinarimonas sp.]
MTQDQGIFLAILVATVTLFIWGRWRHDMVAAAALLACVAFGLVDRDTAFEGFGHPAVVTVACVLILSRALQTSGAVDAIAQRFIPSDSSYFVTLAALTTLGAVLSAFMNNVGALALLMPIAIQMAAKHGISPGKVLMPLSFGSILGGMTTLIGTPPNLIVAGFRRETGESSFTMFDFAPVGVTVALAGLAFLLIFGRKLVPERGGGTTEGFETDAYMTEARVPSKSKAVGMTLKQIEKELDEVDATIVGLIRNEVRMRAPDPWRKLRIDDILVIEAEPDSLAGALSALELKLEEDKPRDPDTPEAKADAEEEDGRDNETSIIEMVVLPNSSLIGRSAADIHLRTRFAINMLAVSRQGQRSRARLRTFRLRAGDVLLLQGAPQRLSEFATQFALVPLAERSVRIPDASQALMALGIMGVAIGFAAFGLLPAAIAFAFGVLAVMALRIIPPRNIYNAIDWPVIVLLGALIPVAGAMAETGTAELIADTMMTHIAQGNAIIALAIMIIVTMTLSDFMNNAATAAVMCPIAIGAASALGVSADPLLMGVAVGASCAFLTPIGHQNNTLILGPGGFRFGDYWKLGLPLEVIVVAVSVPLIPLVWPF